MSTETDTATGLSASPPPEILPTPIKVSWGIGAFGVAILMNGISGLMVYYMTKIVGMPGWIAGVLLSVARLVDAVNDPLMGHVSDRTSDRWGGRRRPYLLVGSFLCAASILLCFNIPFRGDSWLTIGYALFTLLFYGMAYSTFNVPFIAMPAEMTSGYHERSSIHGWRVIFAGMGMALAGAGAGLLLSWFSGAKTNGVQVNDQHDYSLLSLIFAVLILISTLTAWRGTRGAPATNRSETKLPWKVQFSSFMRNGPFMVIMGVKALQLIGVYASQTATFFMVVEVLQRSSADLAYIGLPSLAVSMLVTPLLLAFARRFGKRVGYMASALFAAASYISWAFAVPGEAPWILALRGMMLGVGFAGNVLFAMSMITDAIEWDNHRTGLRREGMYTAVFSFVEKFAGAIGPTIVGIAMSWAGFSATSKVTPETYETLRQAALIGVTYVPVVCALLSVLTLFLYRLDEKTLRQMRQTGTQARAEERAAVIGLTPAAASPELG